MRALLLAGVITGGWVWSAQAAVTQYTSQAAFNAAVPGLTVQTFNTPIASQMAEPNPYTYGPLTFLAGFGSNYLTNDGQYGSGIEYYKEVGTNAAVTIFLPSGTTAVGFTFGTYSGVDTVSTAVNGVQQSSVATSAGHPSTSFVGFVNTDPIASVSFINAATSELDIISFQVGSAATAVSEPASLALLGMGVAGLAAVRRRRRAS